MTSRTLLQQLLQWGPAIQPCNSIASLPKDLLGRVAKYLEPLDLLHLRLTCRALSNVRPTPSTHVGIGNILPVEIIQHVLSYLTDDTVALDAARQACKTWRGASYGKHLLEAAVEKLGVNTDIDSLVPRPSSSCQKQGSRLLSAAGELCSKVIEYTSSQTTTVSPVVDSGDKVEEREKEEKEGNAEDACRLNQCDSERCEAARLAQLGRVLAANAALKYNNWRSLKIPRYAVELGHTKTAISPYGLFLFGLDDDARSGRVYAMYDAKSYFTQLRLDDSSSSGSRFWKPKFMFKPKMQTLQPKILSQNVEPSFLFQLPKLDNLGRIRQVEFIPTAEKVFSTRIFLSALIERQGNFAVVVSSFKYTKLSNWWTHEHTVFHDLPRSASAYSSFSVSPIVKTSQSQSAFVAVASSNSFHVLKVPISKDKVGEIYRCHYEGGQLDRAYLTPRWAGWSSTGATEDGSKIFLHLSDLTNRHGKVFELEIASNTHLRFKPVFDDNSADRNTRPTLINMWALPDSTAVAEGTDGVANAALAVEGKDSSLKKVEEAAGPVRNLITKTTKLFVTASTESNNEISYHVVSVTKPSSDEQQSLLNTHQQTRLCLLKTQLVDGERALAFSGVAIENLGTYIAAVFPGGNIRVWVIPYTFEEGRKGYIKPSGDELPYPPEYGKSLGTFIGASTVVWDYRPFETVGHAAKGRICSDPEKGMVLRLNIGCQTGNVFSCDFSDIGGGCLPTRAGMVVPPAAWASRLSSRNQPKRWIGEKSSIKCIKA